MVQQKNETTRIERLVSSPEATIAFCKDIAPLLTPGTVVAFYGDLGSGKTFMIRALCQALGCQEPVTSPTFTLMQQYTTAKGIPVYHFDFYRLESALELYNIGLEEFMLDDGITFIEWAEKVREELPPERMDIQIEFVPDNPEARKITLIRRDP